MQVRRPVTAFGVGLIALAAAGCGGGGDGGPPTGGGSPPAAADLRASGRALAPRVVEGGVAQYTMTVTNAGPDAASNVAIALSVDGGQTLSGVGCAASGGAVCPANLGAAMTVAALPKDGSLSFTLAAAVPGAGVAATLGATLSVQSAADPVASNNAATATLATTPPNSIRLQSDFGDYIGAGGTYAYTRANASIAVSANGGQLSVQVNGDETWFADFKLPASLSQFQTGSFANLTRYPFHDPAVGGLSWSGEGRGCNTLSGSFTVTNVSYANGVLDAIDLNFEQRCENGAAALRGQIHWTSADNTLPPGPVNPPPAGLWAPAAGATPTSGDYVYLQSDFGDYIGGGGTYTYTRANALINVAVTGGRLSVTVNGNERWSGDFQAMTGIAQPQPGYYVDLRRYPFHNPVKGGLSWSGEGRGCNTLRGWFVIDSVSFTAGGLAAVELRFEQRCEGSATAALHGKIRWTVDDTTRPPGPVNPPPAGLWAPAPGATPSSGNYVFLQSDPGDYIGQGATSLYPPANATLNVTASGGLLSVNLAGWFGDFQAMQGLAQLQPGYYGDLQRYPFHNPVKGGLNWSGQGRGCNTLLGWFVVDSVSYGPQGLAAIELRFQQRCEGGVPALYGKIRWTR
jgi:hypothetical protein